MDRIFGRLTVFFENPFWTGVFETVSDGKLRVCRVVFGAEPKDCEVYEYILKNYNKLSFSPAVEAEVKTVAGNPKRIQREARKQTRQTGIGTKSQQAIQRQREKMKSERKQLSRERLEYEKQRCFDLKQKKRKEKHKGR